MKILAKIIMVSAFTFSLGTTSISHAESTGQYLDDVSMTAAVKSAFGDDNQLKSNHIKVTTNKGTVNLSGTVDNKDQATEAARVASQVSGVKSVQDQMQVASDN